MDTNGINKQKGGINMYEKVSKSYKITLDGNKSRVLEKKARQNGMSASEFIVYILHLHLDCRHNIEQMAIGYGECADINLAISNGDYED
ncbi:MAG: hypothetical protein IJY70_03625 [Clostridia bacterium]|nr:hypothetical protein [Clostridia bacterium]